MSIRIKTIFILVPFFIFALILTGTISAITTRSGLVQLAIQAFTFKSNQYEQFIKEQWNLLEKNNLTEDETFISSFKDSISNEARALILNPGESIVGIQNSTLSFTTDDTTEITAQETALLEKQLLAQSTKLTALPKDVVKTIKKSTRMSNSEKINSLLPRSWIQNAFMLDSEKNVGFYFYFLPMDMIIVLNITEQEFLKPVRKIILTTMWLIIFASLLASIVIFFYSNRLVNPLKSMIKSMHQIIETNNFEEKVKIEFRDEIGQLSSTFNVMIGELDSAYRQIKQYAFSAIVAKKNESKIRNIFQKYVPVSVINTLFQDPTSMLIGKNKNLAIMFTDIRGFTSISESFAPDKLVEVLNSYFEQLVDIITKHHGIIDKYIGDAIMAFFGAPVELKNTPIATIKAANDMVIALNEFNKNLTQKKLPKFITGIGINYGLVTVGNIGSEKKMDYTVIGDAVNLSSRLEGLTKQYKQEIIFSNSIYDSIHTDFPCRIIDIVLVKGKTVGEKIFTTTPYLENDNILSGFALHNEAMNNYMTRDYNKAIKKFKEVRKVIPNDFLATMFIERCELYKKKPPPKNWNGIFIMNKK